MDCEVAKEVGTLHAVRESLVRGQEVGVVFTHQVLRGLIVEHFQVHGWVEHLPLSAVCACAVFGGDNDAPQCRRELRVPADAVSRHNSLPRLPFHGRLNRIRLFLFTRQCRLRFRGRVGGRCGRVGSTARRALFLARRIHRHHVILLLQLQRLCLLERGTLLSLCCLRTQRLGFLLIPHVLRRRRRRLLRFT